MTVSKTARSAEQTGKVRRKGTRARRRLRLVLVVSVSVIVLATGALVARSWYRTHRAAESRRQGLALFEERRYGDALPLLAYAARDSSDIDVVIALGECRRMVPERERQHIRTAASYFGAVLRNDPNDLRALRPLLECLIELGYISEASEVARRILAIDPSDVRAREAVLETEVVQGRWGEAAATARTLQEREPSRVRWRAAEIRCLRSAGGGASERLELVRRWREEHPGIAGLVLLESDVLRELGRNAEARSLLEALASSGVEDLESLQALLEALDALGLEGLAEGAIAASRVRFADPAEAVLLEGERRLVAGRLDGMEALLAGIGPSVDAIRAARMLAAASYLRGDPDAARMALSTIGAGKDARSDGILKGLGGASPLERLESLRTEYGERPDDILAAALMADLLLELGETEESLAVLRMAFEAGGARSQPLGLRLVRGASIGGRHPQALSVARTLALRYPADGAVAFALLDAWSAALADGFEDGIPELTGLGDPTASMLAFWEALGSPTGPAAGVAMALAASGRSADASRVLAAVVGSDRSLENVGESVLLALHKAAETIDPTLAARVEAALLARPLSGTAAIAFAARLEDLGRDEDARASLEKWLARGGAGDGGRVAKASRERVERWLRRIGATGEAGLASIRASFDAAPSLEGAALILSTDEAWSDESLVASAVAEMRRVLGPQSLRAAVAGGVAALVFRRNDSAALAAAIAELDGAARRAPDSVSVLVTLAKLLRTMSPPNDVEAANLLQRAVQVQPADLSSYPELVAVLQQLGDYTAAERVIETYIRLAGAELGASRRAARMQEEQGRFVEAAALHERIAGRTRDAVDRLALAKVRQRLGRTSEARTILAELIAEGESPLALPELVLLEARESGLAAARVVLAERGASVDEAVRWAVEADLEYQFGDLALALDSARRLVARTPSATAHQRLCRIAIRASAMKEARTALSRALELAPDDPATLPLAGSILLSDAEGRRQLRELLARMGEGRSDLIESIRFLESAIGGNGEFSASPAILRGARELTVRFPVSPIAWRILVEFLLRSGDERGAALAARTALSRVPSDPAIARLATETAFAAGEPDEALAAANGWRRLGGSELLEADAARALVQLSLGQVAQANATLAPHRQELLARPRSRAALRALVLVELAAGGAMDLAREIGSFGGRDAEQRATIVAAWIESAQYLDASLAVAALRELAPLVDGGDPEFAGLVAAATDLRTASVADASEAAGRVAEELHRRLPADHFARSLLTADLDAARGEIPLAEDGYRSIYEEALRSASTTVDALAGAMAADSDAVLAEAAIAALRAQPLAIAALGNHATLLLDKGGSAARARRLAEIAAAAAPGSEQLAIALARALAATGDAERALRAIDAYSQSPAAAATRAEVLLASGRREEARAALIRALTLSSRSIGVPRRLRERIAGLERAIGAGAKAPTVGFAPASESDRGSTVPGAASVPASETGSTTTRAATLFAALRRQTP
jgi:predicted Zn-dependent protease